MNNQISCQITSNLEKYLCREKEINSKLGQNIFYIALHRDGIMNPEVKEKFDSLTKKDVYPENCSDYLIKNFEFYWAISVMKSVQPESIEVITNTDKILHIYKDANSLAKEIDGKILDINNNKLTWK